MRPPPTKIRRVVVIDDNVDAAEMLAELLRTRGHDTRVAHDGPSALVVLESFRAEVVVLDIGLPGMTGYELARLIRERHTVPKLVALTGYGQAADRERSAAAGFDAHIVKPAGFAEVAGVVEAHVDGD